MVLILALIAVPQGASCSQILDQNWTAGPVNMETGISDEWGLSAQTFTVGISGTLGRVEVYAASQDDNRTGAPPLKIAIWSMVGGLPDSELASRLLPQVNLPIRPSKDWIGADFSDALIDVAVGEQYAIILGSGGPGNGYLWYGHNSNSEYEAGRVLEFVFAQQAWNVPNLPIGLPPGYTQLFRQYVEPVPEPCTASMGLIALFSFAACCLRHSHALLSGCRVERNR